MLYDPSFWVIIVILFAVPALRKWVALILCVLAVIAVASSVAWYWIALWLVLVVPLGVGVCCLMDKFFPMDENGKRSEQKRPFPVAMERPDKFELPTATDASDGFEPPDDLDD